jgi:hypothetical protein
MLRLTLDEECNVGHPYPQRNRRDNPVLVPNSDAREVLMSSCRCILKEEKGRTGYTREARLTAKR